MAEWQTQGTQNPPPLGACGFDSHLRHQFDLAQRVPCGDSQYPLRPQGRVGSTPTSGTTTALRRLLALGVGVVDEFDAFLFQQDADRPEVGQ